MKQAVYTLLVVLVPCDQDVTEGAERAQNRASLPGIERRPLRVAERDVAARRCFAEHLMGESFWQVAQAGGSTGDKQAIKPI